MRHRMQGVIAAAGFASGDRFVVGHWAQSPIGAFSDVMWARPDGHRTLVTADERAARFITAIYDFDTVTVTCLRVTGDGRSLQVAAAEPDAALELRSGPGWHIPPRHRPPALTRWVEAPIARMLMGVRTYGTSPHGVREWYQATTWRPVAHGRAALDGQDLGALAPLDPPCRFGFSEAPRRPSLTEVRPLLEDPSGELDLTLARLTT